MTIFLENDEIRWRMTIDILFRKFPQRLKAAQYLIEAFKTVIIADLYKYLKATVKKP